MLVFMQEYNEDLQILTASMLIIVNIIRESISISEDLCDQSTITLLYQCLSKWKDVKIYDMVLTIFNILFTQSSFLVFLWWL